MNTHFRTLGPREAQLVLTLSEQGHDTLTAAEAIELLGSKGSPTFNGRQDHTQ